MLKSNTFPPGFSLRALTSDDVPQTGMLTESVGWGRDDANFQRLIEWGQGGCFGITSGEQLVATVTTIQYAQQRAWIGMVIVHPDFQRRGLGQYISQFAVDYLQEQGIREIMLSASDQGQPVYERLGFRRICRMQAWLGETYPQTVNPARRMTPDDLSQIIALDAVAFGVKRSQPLKTYVHAFPTSGWCDGEPGHVAGFVLALAKETGLIWITPWIHQTTEGAARLLKTALNALPAGRPVRVNILDYHTEAQRIAAEAGLACRMQTTRMIYDPGYTLPDVITSEYGAAFPAIG